MQTMHRMSGFLGGSLVLLLGLTGLSLSGCGTSPQSWFNRPALQKIGISKLEGTNLLLIDLPTLAQQAPHITKASLERQIPVQYRKNEAIPLGEGETAPGTVLFENNPKHRLELVWQSNKPWAHLDRVIVPESATGWLLMPYGLKIGASIEQIEKINQSPYGISGWGWDYAGTRYSWHKGQLTTFENQYKKMLIARFELKGDSSNQTLYREGPLATTNPLLKKAKPVVYQWELINLSLKAWQEVASYAKQQTEFPYNDEN